MCVCIGGPTGLGIVVKHQGVVFKDLGVQIYYLGDGIHFKGWQHPESSYKSVDHTSEE